MTAAPELLFPYKLEYRESFEDLYAKWRVEKNATEPVFVIENVHFKHDPEWNMRFLSVQNIRDGQHPVWQVVEVLWVAAHYTWISGI